ncbi:hypothetical protein CERSUDRAFT_80818 [Gelatoporia subvermispora B]|uniref:Uncharacterized protein n=1 Tax=Ceriporiopsis subvermispora (strain B) TaxID=914234 RepID=M2PS43_CERS8|nr:hypothetical protein CERSUDRAFT_80818 [Gelatoporia subvermispora B]
MRRDRTGVYCTRGDRTQLSALSGKASARVIIDQYTANDVVFVLSFEESNASRFAV